MLAVAVQTGQVSEKQVERCMGTRDKEMLFARIKFGEIHALVIRCARGAATPMPMLKNALTLRSGLYVGALSDISWLIVARHYAKMIAERALIAEVTAFEVAC